ncbi:hypothetical protein NDA01_23495 [Trichocoleus desertorum AS-A10]|uniref:hypothetical protein n=1 Tax=Trichocoleus desertorum TaxID=1481672 RepID=UPI0032977465
METGITEPGGGAVFFDDLVRQTMAVDLSELMEPAPPRKQRSKGKSRQEGSIVAEVEREAVLAMVDQMEAVKKEEVLAISYPEDVAGWTAAISEWLQTALLPVSTAEISCGLKMLWVEV